MEQKILADLAEAAEDLAARSLRLRQMAKTAVELGERKRDVAEALGISRPTLDRWLSEAGE